MDNKDNTGHRNTGSWNTGGWNTGDGNTGSWNTGSWNTGDRNTGGWNTGDGNTGSWNTGSWNTGDRNTGHRNTGSWNTGGWNTGDGNTGSWNTGSWNTGHRNTGHRNTGYWNTGHRNTGCFNTITPPKRYFFNKLIDFSEWEAVSKPNWIFAPKLTEWVLEGDMTDQDKIDAPTFHTTGGFLRANDIKAEWRKAYDGASDDDIQTVKDWPFFDADVFLEITGLDLREPKAEKTLVVGGENMTLSDIKKLIEEMENN